MAQGDMNNYERKQLWSETTNFDLCSNVFNQCLQEIVKLTFTHEVANMNYLQKDNWAHLLKC